MKSFVVIGLSTFGQYMAKFLAERKFDVIAIDTDEQRVETIKPFVRKGVIADATKKETLENLGVADADAFIVSLGESIDASLLVLLYLKELGAEEVYVKVVTEDHVRIVELLGADELIFPERDSAYRLAQRIDKPDILDYIPLVEGYSIIDLAPPKHFIGKTLLELNLRKEFHVQVIMIKEADSDTVSLIPRPNQTIKASDVLVVIGKDDDLEKLEEKTEKG